MSYYAKEDQAKIARRNARIVQAVLDGSTAAQVGARFRLNRGTVTTICKRAGLRFGPGGNVGRTAIGPKLRREIASAVAGGLPMKDAAERFGRDLSSIYRICRGLGVRFGPKGQAGAIAKSAQRYAAFARAAAHGADAAQLMRRFSATDYTVRAACRRHGVALRVRFRRFP